MNKTSYSSLRVIDEEEALQMILKGTAMVTGQSFFASLVENLSKVLKTHSAWVTEYREESQQLRALAFWSAGEMISNFVIDIPGTPCEAVIKNADLVHYPDNLVDLYPNNQLLKKFHAVSYLGVPLLDTDNRIIGHLAVLDTRPMPKEPRGLTIFHIFAARASAELQRLRAEAEIRRREQKYRRIVETTGQGFLLIDREYKITDVNNAFCNVIGLSRKEILGKTPLEFCPECSRDFLMINRKKILSEE